MLADELSLVSDIARKAGGILLEVYATDFSVDYKGREDPVTEADRLANAFIVAELRKHFPNDGVVAEETKDRSDALRSGRCWYVDPLDGTKEFVARNGEFSVMIGLAIQGEAKLGVVYQPVKKKLYRGIAAEFAELCTERGTERLRVSDKSENLRLVVSRSHRSQKVDDLVRELGIHTEIQSGSVGLKVGLIAEQKADLYVHLSSHSYAWDACAPDAILAGAGGRFADIDGRPMVYGGHELRNQQGLLASNHVAFESVLPIVSRLGQQAGLSQATDQGELAPLESPAHASKAKR